MFIIFRPYSAKEQSFPQKKNLSDDLEWMWDIHCRFQQIVHLHNGKNSTQLYCKICDVLTHQICLQPRLKQKRKFGAKNTDRSGEVLSHKSHGLHLFLSLTQNVNVTHMHSITSCPKDVNCNHKCSWSACAVILFTSSSIINATKVLK